MWMLKLLLQESKVSSESCLVLPHFLSGSITRLPGRQTLSHWTIWQQYRPPPPATEAPHKPKANESQDEVGSAPNSLCSRNPRRILSHMRHKKILENPKCLWLDEVGPMRDRLVPAPCGLRGDGDVGGALWAAAEAQLKAGGCTQRRRAMSPLPSPSSRGR